MRAFSDNYLSANYLIPIRKGWIRKTKNHQQEPEENERSKNNEQRATAIGLEKQTKSHTQISKCGNGHHSLTMLLIGEFIMTSKEKAKKAPSKKDLLREIIELNDLFDVGSLGRTNIANLVVIRNLLKG